jgi:hypothetical protein
MDRRHTMRAVAEEVLAESEKTEAEAGTGPDKPAAS